MIMQLLSTRLAARSAPQTARTLVPDRSRGLLPFSVRKPAAAAMVAALLVGATLPVAQHVGAQGESAVGWIEQAPTPGDESTEVVLDGTELPAGASTVAVDEIIVPYDPNTPGQVEPYDPPAEEQVDPENGSAE
jgi:hypothetical protein